MAELDSLLQDPKLCGLEELKRRAAYKAVNDYFDESYSYIGIGSGSTIVYVVEAIAAKDRHVTNRMVFVPTVLYDITDFFGLMVPRGHQSKQLIVEAGLPLGSIDALYPTGVPHDNIESFQTKYGTTGLADLGFKGKYEILDIAFDGADEIDEELNCIKGGGACLFQEKLIVTSAKKFICVADYRKLQPRLLSSWPTIPIEVVPLSAPNVKQTLKKLGSQNPKLRQGGSVKAGPVVTDNGMWIIDAPFPPLLLSKDLKDNDLGDGSLGNWEVNNLGRRLKQVIGVLEVGLFHGYNGIQHANSLRVEGSQKPVAAYFGMPDGSVEVRISKEIKALEKNYDDMVRDTDV